MEKLDRKRLSCPGKEHRPGFLVIYCPNWSIFEIERTLLTIIPGQHTYWDSSGQNKIYVALTTASSLCGSGQLHNLSEFWFLYKKMLVSQACLPGLVEGLKE